MLLQEKSDAGAVDVSLQHLPVLRFSLKDKHSFPYLVAMLTFRVIDEELLVELRVGDVGKPLVVGLLLLLHPLLVIIVTASTTKDNGYQQTSPKDGFLLPALLPSRWKAFSFLLLLLLWRWVGGGGCHWL